jgi:hypothetical protein
MQLVPEEMAFLVMKHFESWVMISPVLPALCLGTRGSVLELQQDCHSEGKCQRSHKDSILGSREEVI